MVGPSGAGKTVLLKRLKSMCEQEEKERKAASFTAKYKSKKGEALKLDWSVKTIPVTQSTTGTTVVSLNPHNCILKEYGYSMASLWKKATEHTDAVIFVVDGSNPQQLSAAIVLLMELLADEAMVDKPVLLFYSKTDLPSSMSVYEMKEIMRVRDLVRTKKRFTVHSGSCATGEGLDEVLRWITSTLCSQTS